jgi:broad specificity phosphatase PhoE/predicted kinase
MYTTSERVLQPSQKWSQAAYRNDDDSKDDSESTWIGNPSRNLILSTSEKKDLLHRGHNKGGKLLVVMVGLPGSYKTLIARKVARFLRWNSYNTLCFSIAKYRLDKLGSKSADFFDPENKGNAMQRMIVLAEALEDAVRFLHRGGEIAILDGTNTTRERRNTIRQRLAREDNYEILWIESKRLDDDVLEPQKLSSLKESPDFLNASDYEKRVEHYRARYESVGDDEGSFVRIYNQFNKFTLHQTQGFLPTKIVSFVVNLKPTQRSLCFCRHGESNFNARGLLGGDSGLSARGIKFSVGLATFFANQDKEGSELKNVTVWVSTMRRTKETADAITCAKKRVEWRALNDLDVGVCDGMTYEGVKSRFPEEYHSRNMDKLRYRYPGGESYLDLMARLEPVIIELERGCEEGALMIIAHQAVLRCLYAYYLDLPAEETPYLDIPVHTVIHLEALTFGCREKRHRIAVDAKGEEGSTRKISGL